MLELFLTFAKIGLFTIGGGYAMIAIIEDACVEQKKWLTHEEMMELIVIAESTPGPIAINCATYTGYRRRGIWGAVAATLGMVLPSFIIIFLISLFFENLLEIGILANAVRGIRIGVGIVILNAGWNMRKKTKGKALAKWLVLFGFGTMLMAELFALKISSIVVMLTGGLVSLVVFLAKEGRENDIS